MRILIIGYGSIGKRHARLLEQRGAAIAVVTAQKAADKYPIFSTIPEALRNFFPTHALICSPTARHGEDLAALAQAGFTGNTLVEKPVVAHAAQAQHAYPFHVHVAYHLRFHPVIVALRGALEGKRLLSAHIYVGQHLTQWRPGRDTKSTYSAHKSQGGGVLRDLSHELDLAQHIFGSIETLRAVGGRVSNITEDSEDAVAIALRALHCPVVSLQMNYLDHMPRREWIVNTPEASFRADIIGGTLTENASSTVIACPPDAAYIAMHTAWLDEGGTRLCTLQEGLTLVRLIDTISL